jgi:mannose-1-phosphate guanylyltransferase
MKPYRALLLAAGLGKRLRPLTLSTPKCLAKIGERPVIGMWLEKLERSGCEAVLINTHYLSDQVISFVKGRKRSAMRIETVHEPELLGTAGTLLANRAFLGEMTSLMIHADNAMMDGLFEFLEAHENRPRDCDITMLTFRTKRPKSCGIVELGKSGRIVGFHEKVDDPPGDLANGALYAIEPSFLDSIGQMQPAPIDFSKDVIPRFIARFQTWQTKSVYIDIGTTAALEEANDAWEAVDR